VDIKIVEAYLKRVIQAADEMYATVYDSNETLEDAIIWNMQMAADQYKMAKSLFVSASKEFHIQKGADKIVADIYSEADKKYYEDIEEALCRRREAEEDDNLCQCGHC